MSAMDSILASATATAEPTVTTTTNEPTVTPSAEVDVPDDAVADATSDLSDEGDGSSEENGDKDGENTPPKLPSTAEIRASLKAFRDASPEHAQAAKLLNDGYSRYEAYKQVFPTVDDARNFKTQLDTLGGIEGIANMQSTLASVEETDALLESGDPRVLDAIFEDSPEGAKKLAPHFLNKLAKIDSQTYERTLQPHLVRSLMESNFPQVLGYLASKLGDNADAKAVVANMQQWFEGQKSLAERTNADTLSPERDQLNKDREAIQSERRKDFETQVGGAVSTHINSELGGKLRPYAAALNALPVAVRQDVARACITELANALKADKAYQTQVNAMMGARKPDRDKIIAFNKNKVSSLANAVIEKVVKGYNLKPGAAAKANVSSSGKAKAGAQKASISTKIVKLNAPPKDADIDWSHENMSTEAYIRHRAILKGGKMVSW